MYYLEEIKKVKKIDCASIYYDFFTIEARSYDDRNVEVFIAFGYKFIFLYYDEKYEENDIVDFLGDTVKSKDFWMLLDKALTNYMQDNHTDIEIINKTKKYISMLDFEIDYADSFIEEYNKRKQDINIIQNAMTYEHMCWTYEEQLRCILEHKDKYVILDTETTGLSYREDRIIELGIIDLDGNILFDSLVYTDATISHEAYTIHGIKQEDLEGKPTIEELKNKLDSILKDKIIVGYNVQFDINMLDVSGYNDIVYNKSYCLMNTYMNYKKYSFFCSLQWALMSENIDTKQRHRAIDDAFCCLGLIKKIASKSQAGGIYYD